MSKWIKRAVRLAQTACGLALLAIDARREHRERQERIRASEEWVQRNHAKTFEKLAEWERQEAYRKMGVGLWEN